MLKRLDAVDSAQTDLGDTPLHLAASHGNAQVFSPSLAQNNTRGPHPFSCSPARRAGSHADF